MVQLHNSSYNSNPLLKPCGTIHSFTLHEAQEYKKCEADPIYFIENYVKVVSVDHGLVPLILHDFQKEMVLNFWKKRFNVVLAARQVGKSTIVAAFFVWYTLFHKDKVCAILANKAMVAREILSRYQKAYENIPKFLQQGVITFNKGSVELENGSKIMAASTSSSAIRGFSLNVVFLDEYAFVHPGVADEFFTSVWPTLSSGKKSKMIISSTPNGFNHFYKIWNEAEQGMNGFHSQFVHWSDMPGRDEKWRKEQFRILGEDKFSQEMEAEFLGSSNTLIHSSDIKNMSPIKPIHVSDSLKIFRHPEKYDQNKDGTMEHKYVIVCDPARGTGNDSSAFVVFDVTNYPIRLAASFQDPLISPLVLPTILDRVAKTYNDAHVLVEINDNGQQVADILWRDLEYENTVIFGGFGAKKSNYGVRTTTSVKRQGCTLFKDMVSSQKIVIDDLDLISEISTFILRQNTYKADVGAHDDLVMCCILFAWFATTAEYQNLSDMNYKQALLAQKMEYIESDVLPFGFIADGINHIPDEDEDIFWGEPVTWGY